MRVSFIVLAVAAAAWIVVAGCGKKAEEAETVGTAETPAEAEGTAEVPEDFGAAFEAKVAEVDEYMKAHNVENTPADEIAATLDGFKAEFEALAEKAAADEALAARCGLAAESMGLYADSLRDDPLLSIDAEVKWNQVKEGLAGGPPS
jgi:hypothetical protein